MTTLQFLAEWTLRSSILILSGALLLWVLRVKDSSVRLAAWTAILAGSLAIPALTAVLPKLPFTVARWTALPAETPVMIHEAPAAPVVSPPHGVASHGARGRSRFDWTRGFWIMAGVIYVLISLALLLRLCVGLVMSLRLLRGSRASGQVTEGIEIRESDRVGSPVVLGITRPAIVLPRDWRKWDGSKLDAVLAHERSHIWRHDPAVQLISAIHRALLWHSPLSWFLHQRIVRAAEEASDDAALAATRDRVSYAEVLLDFMQRGVNGAGWHGVAMARYGQPDQRIQRILDGTTLPRGVTRWSIAAIVALGSPLAYAVATAHLQSVAHLATPVASTEEMPASDAVKVERSNHNSVGVAGGGLRTAQNTIPQIGFQAAPAARPEPTPAYLDALGTVVAVTVSVKPRVDGQLMSVSFNEGDLVQAGQALASIDPRPYQVQVDLASGQLARDQAQLAEARRNQSAMVAQLEGGIRTDQANLENAQLLASYAHVNAPITGVAGLRLVDPGNIVHAADSTGIVIITQIQPIAVLFTIPEDRLPDVLARLRGRASVPVEAWNRENTVKIATGRLTAVDNQIDPTTGTAKLKALFDNYDRALFPNQFVVVRLVLSGQ